MSDAIFYKLHPSVPLRTRILHRIANLLCRVGLHDWSFWHEPRLFGRSGWQQRSCWHCTADQERRKPD